MSADTHLRLRDCAECPCCGGGGQVTGPKSWAYQFDPDDPFNRVVRLCEECEGTGVVTAVRRAGLDANTWHKIMPIVDKVMGEWRDDLAALAEWENEGGLCV